MRVSNNNEQGLGASNSHVKTLEEKKKMHKDIGREYNKPFPNLLEKTF